MKSNHLKEESQRSHMTCDQGTPVMGRGMKALFQDPSFPSTSLPPG